MQQLPLDLRWRALHTLDDFVFADAGTWALIQRALAAESVQPLLLLGPKGAGKSALMHGLAGFLGCQDSASAVLTLSDQTPASAIENAELALFDGLENLASALEWPLFSRFNRSHDQRAVFVVSSALGLDDLAIKLPDLRSRLAQCLPIQLPLLQSDTERRAVLTRQAIGYGLSLSEELLDFLMIHVSRDLAALADVLKFLHTESLSRKKPLTLAQARIGLRSLSGVGQRI
jgi:DnaA-homolog protein